MLLQKKHKGKPFCHLFETLGVAIGRKSKSQSHEEVKALDSGTRPNIKSVPTVFQQLNVAFRSSPACCMPRLATEESSYGRNGASDSM